MYPTHITVIIALLLPRQVLLRIVATGLWKEWSRHHRCSNVLETLLDLKSKVWVLTLLSPTCFRKVASALCVLISLFVYRKNNICSILIWIVINSKWDNVCKMHKIFYFDVGKYGLSEQYQVLVWIFSMPT